MNNINNKMNNLIVLKRTNNELEYFIKKKYLLENISKKIKDIYTELTFIPYIKNENKYHIKIQEKNKLILDLEFPNEYPFKCAKIYYNHLTSINYNKYLINVLMKQSNKYTDNIDILLFYFKILFQQEPIFLNNKKECYCCKSLTCLNNWNPNLKINNMIFEYYECLFIQENSNIKNYILNKRCYEKITDEYLKGNNDILSHILSFI